MDPKGAPLASTDLLEISELVSGSYVTKSITGQEIIDSVPPTSVEWGDIGGVLSTQIDLQNALNGKQDDITLTTTGTSGASTFVANTLNVPTYSLAGLGGVPTTRTLTINGTTQDLSADRTFTISTGITIGTTAITSGTVGRVLFEGTGNVVSESANLFWDNTNGRLGIGTSSPTTIVHINGNTAGTAPSLQIRQQTNTVPTWFAVRNTDTLGSAGAISLDIGISGGSGQFFTGTSQGDIILKAYSQGNTSKFFLGATSGSTAQMVLFPSTGNIGINTTTDAGYKLDVNGTARVVNQATIQTLTIGLGGGAVATNTALGLNALTSNTTGANNTSVGSGSLRANTIGDYNTSVGLDALRFNTGGGQNTAVGWRALNSVLTGYGNVAVGSQALISTTGGFNIGIGERAGESNTTGTYNICIGAQTQTGNFSNSVILGRSATATASNQFVVGTETYNVGSVTTEVNASTQVWNVIINGVARKILLA